MKPTKYRVIVLTVFVIASIIAIGVLIQPASEEEGLSASRTFIKIANLAQSPEGIFWFALFAVLYVFQPWRKK